MGFLSSRAGLKIPSPLSIPGSTSNQEGQSTLLDQFSREVGSATSASDWIIPETIDRRVEDSSSAMHSPGSSIDCPEFIPLHLRGGSMDDLDDHKLRSPIKSEMCPQGINRGSPVERFHLQQGSPDSSQRASQTKALREPRFNPRITRHTHYLTNVRLYSSSLRAPPSVDDSDDDEELDDFSRDKGRCYSMGCNSDCESSCENSEEFAYSTGRYSFIFDADCEHIVKIPPKLTRNKYKRFFPGCDSDCEDSGEDPYDPTNSKGRCFFMNYESDSDYSCYSGKSHSEGDIGLRISCSRQKVQLAINESSDHSPNFLDAAMPTGQSAHSMADDLPATLTFINHDSIIKDWIHMQNWDSCALCVTGHRLPESPTPLGLDETNYEADDEESIAALRQNVWISNRRILRGSDASDFEYVEDWECARGVNLLDCDDGYDLSAVSEFFDALQSQVTTGSLYGCIIT